MIERPPYAKHFPDDERLLRAVALFEGGDYRSTRAILGPLKEASSPGVRRAAAELEARMDPAPAAKALLIVAGLIFAGLSYHYLSLPHPESGAPSGPARSAESPK